MVITQKLQILKQSKVPSTIAWALICLVTVLIIGIFIRFFQMKQNLDNPLIPKDLIVLAFEPHALKGGILSIGLFVILIFKAFGQNLIVIIVAIILLIWYLISAETLGFW